MILSKANTFLKLSLATKMPYILLHHHKII